MKNRHIIFLNNSAVDALHAGDIAQGFTILSKTFFMSVRNKHRSHNLSAAPGGNDRGLEFCLQDCSRNLERVLNKWFSDDESCRSLLCLNFLRMEIPSCDSQALEAIDELCSCTVAWALGFNLSCAYALLGYLSRNPQDGRTYFKKSLRMLGPIKRQVLLQQTQAPFWTYLKLCILNNYACINSETQNEAERASTVRAMDRLLVKSHLVMDPIDVKKFYLSIQFLNMCNSFAAAA